MAASRVTCPQFSAIIRPMPEMVRKELLNVGTYFAPQGRFEVTRDRMARWVDQFRALKREGYKIPVPWGHQLSAMPRPDQVDGEQWKQALQNRQYEEAKFNASYVDDLELTPDGKLVISMPAPPGYHVCPHTNDLINERDGTRIREVSGAFGNWTDGRGRKHHDVLIHAALCTRPVMGNQSGFQPADAMPHMLSTGYESVEYSFTLSSGAAMAKDDDDDDKKPSKKGSAAPAEDDVYEPEDDLGDAGDAAGADSGMEDAPPLEDMPPAPDAPPLPDPAATVNPSGPDDFKECVRLLGEMGLPIPPDVTEKDFCKSLKIALTVGQGMGARFERQDAADDIPAAPASATSGGPGGPGAGQSPTAEPPPNMMSTLPNDPFVQQQARRTEKAIRKEIKTICGQLKTMGVPVHQVEELEAKSSTFTLSLAPSGDGFKTPHQVSALRAVRKTVRAMRGEITAPTTLSTAVAPPSPIRPKLSNKQADPDVMAALRKGAASATGVEFSKN